MGEYRKNSDWCDVFATLRWAYVLTAIFYITHYIVNYQTMNYEYLGKFISNKKDVVRYDPETHAFDEVGHVITFKTDDGVIKSEDFPLSDYYEVIHTEYGSVVYKNHQHRFIGNIIALIVIYVVAVIINAVITDNVYGAHWGSPISLFSKPFKCKE